MEKKTRVLLIGGHGFIGSGLCRELKRRNVAYRSIDIFDLDLTDNNNIDSLSKIIGRYTNVVLLAANVGRKLFDADKGNQASPIVHAERNHLISFNVAQALTKRFYAGKKPVDFTYYSSSEVYGNCEGRCNAKTVDLTIDTKNPRTLYAIEKLADETMFSTLRNFGAISHLKILRPFNISGAGQKRGVVFEMFRDAFVEKSIWYSKDTLRTMTDIDYASKRGVDEILRTHDKTANIVDRNGSVSMCVLATLIGKEVEKITGERVKIVERNQDCFVWTRCIYRPDRDSAIHVKKLVGKWVSELERGFVGV